MTTPPHTERGTASPSSYPPTTPPRFTTTLPTTDTRDTSFIAAASRRSNQIYPDDGLLWSPWDDPNDVPPTPGAPLMRCIPLPQMEEPAVRTTSSRGRERGYAASYAQLHPALGPTLSYDFTQRPEDAYIMPSSSALGLFYMSPDPSLSWPQEPRTSSPSLLFSSSSSPFTSSSASSSSSSASFSSAYADTSYLLVPYDEPATQPPTRTLLLDIGPYQDVLIFASNDAYVTCWDVLAQLHGFLSLPLDDPYALDVSLERVIEAYQEREREAAQDRLRGRGRRHGQGQGQGQRRDVLRNVDALMGETEWGVMSLRSGAGTDGRKWVIKTRRPDSVGVGRRLLREWART